MVPVFARPGNVYTFSDQAAFMAFLDQFEVPYQSWDNKDKKLEKLWKEIVDRDAVYVSGAWWGKPTTPVRFLITVSARIILKHPEDGFLVLLEFVRDGEFYRPRRYVESSLSEKAKLTSDGVLAEDNVSTIQRCLAEEVRMSVPYAVLADGLHFMPHVPSRPLLLNSSYVEEDYAEKILTMRGLWSLNQVAHYVCYLPDEYHFISWRKDSSTKYLSRWGSAHEASSQLDPIPAEFVFD